MRPRLLTMAFACILPAGMWGQVLLPQTPEKEAPLSSSGPAAQAPILRVQSQLVLVPTNVQTRHGEILYGLKVHQFEIEADGVPQRVQLDQSEDVRPLSIAVVVQCSRAAYAEWDKIKGLPTMVDSLVGGAPAHVAVIDYGAEPELLTGFTKLPDRRGRALAEMQPCPDDSGAATLDALAYANQLFEHANPPGRRVILLISETRDHGSRVKPQEIIQALGRSNVIVDAIAFSPGRDEIKEDLKHQDGASGGLVGLVLMAVQALRKNVPKELARQTGGEYINFGTALKFDQGLNGLANRVGNYYSLSFQPRFPPPPAEDPGRYAGPLHSIAVHVTDYADAVVRHRETYWADPVSATDFPAAEPKAQP